MVEQQVIKGPTKVTFVVMVMDYSIADSLNNRNNRVCYVITQIIPLKGMKRKRPIQLRLQH